MISFDPHAFAPVPAPIVLRGYCDTSSPPTLPTCCLTTAVFSPYLKRSPAPNSGVRRTIQRTSHPRTTSHPQPGTGDESHDPGTSVTPAFLHHNVPLDDAVRQPRPPDPEEQIRGGLSEPGGLPCHAHQTRRACSGPIRHRGHVPRNGRVPLFPLPSQFGAHGRWLNEVAILINVNGPWATLSTPCPT